MCEVHNPLATLCKEFERISLESTEIEPDSWFVELNRVNERIGTIDPSFKKSEKQMGLHIINNLCEGYEEKRMTIENDDDFLDNIETIKIQEHWEKYYEFTEVPSSPGKEKVKEEDALTLTKKTTGQVQ